MNRILVVMALLITAAAFAERKPDKLPLSTWVREDLFAGFLANDTARLEAGMKKVDEFLAENPDSAQGVAWRGLGEIQYAVRALEAGKPDEFQRLYDKTLATFERASKLGGPDNEAVRAIVGGTFSTYAERLPERLRKDAYQRVYDNLLALKEVQKAYFDQLPVHMRGEVLAGLAQASQRLGKEDEMKAYLAQVVAALPGSPYASRAAKWIERPELQKTVSLTCQTCHEPGRLKNRMAALEQAPTAP
jgi:tetratricopeptide (TPR) repeat protein